jgi:hypothetical protein
MKKHSIKKLSCALLMIALGSYVFSQAENSVHIKITKNDKLIVDTLLKTPMSDSEIEMLVASLTGEGTNDEGEDKNVEVRVIKTGSQSELDSLLQIAGASENDAVTDTDDKNGTEIDNGIHKEYEIKINSDGRNSEDEETIIIEKHISKEQTDN